MSEWEPTQPHEPTEPIEPAATGPEDVAGPVHGDPGLGADSEFVTEPMPDDELAPWYRQRGPVAAVIAVGLAVLFFLVAFLIWLFAGDDEQLATIESTTTSTSEVTTAVPTSAVATLVPTTTATPATTVPATTVAPTTDPSGTEPPTTTGPPTTTAPTVSPTIVAPPPPPPTAAPPSTAAPTTAAPATTAAPTTAPTTTTGAPQVTEPPDADATVWDIVAASADLSRLRDLLVFADLDDDVAGDGPLTLFAPSNDAFDALEAAPGGAELLANRGRVRALLLRHLIDDDRVDADDLFGRDEVTVANGDRLQVDADAGTVDGSRVVIADVEGANGVLHVLDRVMVP